MRKFGSALVLAATAGATVIGAGTASAQSVDTGSIGNLTTHRFEFCSDVATGNDIVIQVNGQTIAESKTNGVTFDAVEGETGIFCTTIERTDVDETAPIFAKIYNRSATDTSVAVEKEEGKTWLFALSSGAPTVTELGFGADGDKDAEVSVPAL